MSKTLTFQTQRGRFDIDEKGRIKGNGLPAHSDTWLFLGVSKHHWRNGIDVGLSAAFENPLALIGGYVWDKDHGTTRRWGGGGNVRVTAAYVKSI